MIMLNILVGPNGCGKSKFLEQFTGEPCRLPQTSGLEKLQAIKEICDLGFDVHIDNVDVYIDNEHIQELADTLLKAAEKVDVWVSTHNVLLLNYLEDQVAIDSVFLVNNGNLFSFFEGYLLEKLEVMGPGEAFCDTDLNAWWEMCHQRSIQASLEGLHTKEALEGSV